MPEQDPTQTDAEVEPTETPDPLAERLAAVEARLAGQTRESVISSAVPTEVLSSPMGRFFAQNYQGDISPAAVEKAAIEAGLIPDPTADNEAGTATDAEREAHNSSLDLRHSGVPVEGLQGQHPDEIAREAAKAARRMGTEDEALGAYIESHARTILSGDNRRQINLFSGAGAVRGR